jgi:hypothetical protein
MAKSVKAESIKQEDPETIITLKDGIYLKHNYKKKDQITIELKEFGETYLVSTKKELEEIYRIYLTNTNFVQLLCEWANKNLNKL